MKIEVHIDDRLVAGARRLLSRRNLAVLVLLAGFGSAVAIAAVPHEFAAGETISAAQMNANLAAATVATHGDVQYSLNATFKAATEAHHYGDMMGWHNVKRLCEEAVGTDTAHMCTSEEIARSAQLGIDISGSGTLWFSTGVASRYYQGSTTTDAQVIRDCVGWTSSLGEQTGNIAGMYNGNLEMRIANCDGTHAVACCD